MSKRDYTGDGFGGNAYKRFLMFGEVINDCSQLAVKHWVKYRSNWIMLCPAQQQARAVNREKIAEHSDCMAGRGRYF